MFTLNDEFCKDDHERLLGYAAIEVKVGTYGDPAISGRQRTSRATCPGFSARRQ